MLHFNVIDQEVTESWKEVGCLSPSEQLFVLLTFQIICQSEGQHENWIWSDLWYLLIIAIKLKDKYFHNSLNSSVFFSSILFPTCQKRSSPILLEKKFSRTLRWRQSHCPTRKLEGHVRKWIETCYHIGVCKSGGWMIRGQRNEVSMECCYYSTVWTLQY